MYSKAYGYERTDVSKFDLSHFSSSMAVAICGFVVAGMGFELSKKCMEEGLTYIAYGVAPASFIFALWMAVVFGHQITRAFK